MHRSHLSDNSRGHSSSPYPDRSTPSTSRGRQPSGSSSYLSAYQSTATTRGASPYESRSRYGPSPYDTSSYEPSSTVDPSVLTGSSYPAYGSSSYSSSSNDPYTSPSEMSYTYRDPVSGPYGTTAIYPRSPSQSGYSNPSTEASLSRSMSGPLVPSILPSSTYEEVRNIGREFVARQQRKKFNRPRREKKLDFRRALLPSNASAGSGQAEDVNSSIDSFTAQSSSSFDNTHYGSTPMDYPINSRVSGPYNPSYLAGYPASTNTMYPTMTAPSRSEQYYDPRRSSTVGPSPSDPSLRENPAKPQCWEHGCNGRQFSTFSNLLRHQREKSGASAKAVCHRCGAEFTRKTARDGHLNHDKCKAKSPMRRP